MLPAASIVPSGDNPRRDLGDLEELAASIAGVGLLEPLVVAKPTPDAPEVYPLVAGHRRLAAAQLAGLTELPCVVRAMSGREQLEAMLVENLQRTDLAPIEEAGAYGRLTTELGLSQRDLAARIGRSQSHIAKRLALLDLPANAVEALDSGRITLEEAWSLTRLAAHPDRLQKALKDGERYTGGVKREVERLLGEVEAQAKRDALEVQLRDQGAKVLPTPKEHRLGREAALQQPETWSWQHSVALPFTPEQHAAEECHAGIVWGPRYGKPEAEVFWVCTSPARHAPDGKSDLKVPKGRGAAKSAAAPEQQAQKEQERQEREARKARGEFLRSFLNSRAWRSTQDAEVHIFDMLLEDANHAPAKTACDLLGVEVPAVKDQLGTLHRSPQTALRDYVGGDPGKRLKAALALVLGLGEEIVGSPWGTWNQGKGKLHVGYLVKAGHELSPFEKAKLEEQIGEGLDDDFEPAEDEGEALA
jgi:ParB family chromosome partitioning protein